MNYCDLGFRTPHPCEFLVHILTASQTDSTIQFFIEDIAGNTASILLDEKNAKEFLAGFNQVYPKLAPLTKNDFNPEHPDCKSLPGYHSVNLRAPVNHYVVRHLPPKFNDPAHITPHSVHVYSNTIGGALDYNAYMMLGLATKYASMSPELISRFKADTLSIYSPNGDMDVWIFFTAEQVEQLNSFLNF